MLDMTIKKFVKKILIFVLWILFVYQVSMGLLKTIDEFSIGSIIRNMLPAILLGGLIVIILVLRDLNFVRTLYSKPEITVKQGILLGIASLLPGVLIILIGERGIVDLVIILTVIGSFFLSLYFMTSGKGFNAVITFLLAFPFLSLVEQWFNYVPLNFIWGSITLTPTIAFLLTLFFFSLLPRQKESLKHFMPVSLRWSILIFLFISIFSSILSIDPLKSLQSLYLEYVCPLILFIIILKNIEEEKQIKILAYTLLISGVIINFNALYFFGRYFKTMSSDITDLDTAFLAGNFNSGSWMNMVIMILPIAIVLFVLSTNKRFNMIVLGSIILFLLATTVLSFVRTAILSTAVLLMTLIVGKKSRRIVFAFLIVFAIGILANKSFLEKYIEYNFKNVGSLVDIREDSSLLHRENAWKAAIKMIKDYPILGIGTGLWDEYIPRYGTTQPVVVASNSIRYGWGYINSPHNYYIQVAVHSGLLGFIAWLCILVSVFREGIYALLSSKKNDYRFYLSLGAIAGLLAYLTWCFLGGGFADGMFLGVGFYFFVLAAIIVKLGNLEKPKNKNSEELPGRFNYSLNSRTWGK